MRIDKRVQVITLIVLSLLLVGTIVTINLVTNTNKQTVEVKTVADTSSSRTYVMGVSADLQAAQTLMTSGEIGVEKTCDEMVAAALGVRDNETETDEDLTPEVVDKEVTKTQAPSESVKKKWAKRVMAKVTDFLVIRESASSSSKALAKMLPTTAVKLVKYGKEWTKVKSGDITGYVYTKYTVTGDAAYNYYQEVCGKMAVVNSGVEELNVRKKADESSDIVGTVKAGDKLEIVEKEGLSSEWVAVKYEKKTCYVSAEYVTLKKTYSDPVIVEDGKLYETDYDGEPIHDTYEATKAEKKLLAAIIECEVGSSTYEAKVAVGAVVMNRVRNSHYPDSIKGVIYQSGQFTPAHDGKLQRVLDNGLHYPDCMDAALDALAGKDPTGGLYHFNYKECGRSGMIIGSEVFY